MTYGIPRGIHCHVEILPCLHDRQHSNETKRDWSRVKPNARLIVVNVVQSNVVEPHAPISSLPIKELQVLIRKHFGDEII